MKRKPEIIVMLTNNDVTSKDSYEIFESCKDLNAKHWGFKNVGLSDDEIIRVGKAMKAAGKTTYFEVISYNDEAYLHSAELAYEAGFDYVTGTKYSELLHNKLRAHGIGYSPFVGEVGVTHNGRTGMLRGEYNDIIAEGRMLLEEKKVTGLDVSAYRHIEDGEKLIRLMCEALPDKDITIAGSVDSFSKIDTLFECGVTKFTMGSVLFNKKFVPEGTFRDNLIVVLDYMASK